MCIFFFWQHGYLFLRAMRSQAKELQGSYYNLQVETGHFIDSVILRVDNTSQD